MGVGGSWGVWGGSAVWRQPYDVTPHDVYQRGEREERGGGSAAVVQKVMITQTSFTERLSSGRGTVGVCLGTWETDMACGGTSWDIHIPPSLPPCQCAAECVSQGGGTPRCHGRKGQRLPSVCCCWLDGPELRQKLLLNSSLLAHLPSQPQVYLLRQLVLSYSQYVLILCIERSV